MEARDSSPKSPLLFNERRRLTRGNSVNSLRTEFLARLPGKLRNCVDVESPSHIDISKAKGLTTGLFVSLENPYLFLLLLSNQLN